MKQNVNYEMPGYIGQNHTMKRRPSLRSSHPQMTEKQLDSMIENDLHDFTLVHWFFIEYASGPIQYELEGRDENGLKFADLLKSEDHCLVLCNLKSNCLHSRLNSIEKIYSEFVEFCQNFQKIKEPEILIQNFKIGIQSIDALIEKFKSLHSDSTGEEENINIPAGQRLNELRGLQEQFSLNLTTLSNNETVTKINLIIFRGDETEKNIADLLQNIKNQTKEIGINNPEALNEIYSEGLKKLDSLSKTYEQILKESMIKQDLFDVIKINFANVQTRKRNLTIERVNSFFTIYNQNIGLLNEELQSKNQTISSKLAKLIFNIIVLKKQAYDLLNILKDDQENFTAILNLCEESNKTLIQCKDHSLLSVKYNTSHDQNDPSKNEYYEENEFEINEEIRSSFEELVCLGFKKDKILELLKKFKSKAAAFDELFKEKHKKEELKENEKIKKNYEETIIFLGSMGFNEQVTIEAFKAANLNLVDTIENLINEKNISKENERESELKKLIDQGFNQELSEYALTKCGSFAKSKRFIKSLISTKKDSLTDSKINAKELLSLQEQGFSLCLAIKSIQECKETNEEQRVKWAQNILIQGYNDYSYQLDALVLMGFPLEEAFLAIESTGGQINSAINLLTKDLMKIRNIESENNEETKDPLDCKQKIEPENTEKKEIKDMPKLTQLLDFWPKETEIKEKIMSKYDEFDNKQQTIMLMVLQQLQSLYKPEIPEFLSKCANSSQMPLFSLFNETNEFQAQRKALFLGNYILSENTGLNQFEELIQELIVKNPDKNLSVIIKRVKTIFIIFKAFQHSYSQIFPEVASTIDNWSKTHFSKIKDRLYRSFLQDELKFGETLALISKAVNLFKGAYFYPKDTQIISVIIMSMSETKGILTQINTGEGKSLIVAILVLIRRLQRYRVDVVSSSSVLAERDGVTFSGLFQYFTFKVTNCRNGEDERYAKIKEYNRIFKHDIIYGDVFEFECALIEKTWFKETINNFEFENRFILVDEVDSMMIDNLQSMAQIASPTTGNDQINQFLMMVWKKTAQLDRSLIEQNNQFFYRDPETHRTFQVASKDEFAKKQLLSYCQELMNKKGEIYPLFLKNYVQNSYSDWVDSAIKAAFYMDEEKDYLNTKDGQIVPVDMATGVLQAKTKWGKALHQFLEIKHECALSAVHSTHAFISNVSYFLNYQSKINGMTGTLGSPSNIANLTEIYGLETYIIPPFKKKQFQRLDEVICKSEDWIPQIVERAIYFAKIQKRAVLIINNSIAEARNIHKAIIHKLGGISNGIFLYTRSDDESQTQVTENTLQEGEIVIATNLAGRGTDFKLSETVLQNGGLHVMLTFMPENQRIEDQALGRAARNGQPGSGQLTINGSDFGIQDEMIDAHEGNEKFAKLLLDQRNECERKRNEYLKNNDLKYVRIKDVMYKSFCEFSHLQLLRKDKEVNVHLINEIEDSWAKFIEGIDQKFYIYKYDIDSLKSEYDRFVKGLNDEVYLDSFIQNPYFHIEKGAERINNREYEEALIFLIKAINLDPHAISAYYSKAYCHLNKETDDDGLKKSKIELALAKKQIESYMLPQLSFVRIIFPEKESSKKSDLNKQYDSMMKVYMMKAQFLENSIKEIDSMRGKKFKINTRAAKTVFKDVKDEKGFHDLMDKGFHFVFNLEEIPPKPSMWSIVFVGFIAICEVVGGTLLCFTVAGAKLGTAIICEGIKDACKSYRVAVKGESFSWQEWALEKAVTYAAIALSPMSLSFVADTITETSIEITKTVDEKFGKKLENAFQAYKNYARIINVVQNFDVKQIGKETVKNLALKGIETAMTAVNNFIIDQTVLATISKKIQSFIKERLQKIVMGSISETVKILMNSVLTLSKSLTLSDKLRKLKVSIPKINPKIQKCDQEIRKNFELYEKFISKISNLSFHKDFASILSEIMQTPGKEESVSEMQDIFSNVIDNAQTKDMVCSNLGQIKYLGKIKVLTDKIPKILSLGNAAKNLIVGLKELDLSFDFLGLKLLKDNEVDDVVGDIISIQNFLRNLKGDSTQEVDLALNEVIDQIARDCCKEIEQALSKVVSEQLNGLSTKVIENAIN